MGYLFFLPLAIATLAAYIWQKSQDEIAYLSGVVTVICFLVGLVIAPWQIQLLLLIAVVAVVTQLLTTPAPQPPTIAEGSGGQTQKYRGVSYTETKKAPLITTAKPTLGKYRGVSMPIQHAEPQSQPSSKPKKYRGIDIS
ncbi:MAG: hypothetical protein N5P05_003252 [Chroococcopsis gigantea SAG 12.99]|jgi:hypothetical protein|nr:DUF4278 domain-containing protein [Chlorogloea purpurea SAG 13.99]MDV3001646.1 hypothetical protein [Chroococcopsis gigantea SAG 12.99]